MKLMVGYTVWNKVDHLVWLFEGIIENFSAAETDVAFHCIPHGEFVQLPYLNSGPVAYNANLVRKVGLLDEQFRAHHVWDDYGARATQAGFKNGVLGMDITHAKFGRLSASNWGDPSVDIARLRMKHAGAL